MTNDQDIEDFLAHHGVKGMRWGVHRKGSDGRDTSVPGGATKKSARAEKREAKRTEKAAQRKKDDEFRTSESKRIIAKSNKVANQVEAARMRTYSGANHTKLQDAKAKYKQDRVTDGKAAAKSVLNQVRREVQADYEKSQEWRDGYEATADLLRAATGRETNDFHREMERYREYRDI